MASQLLVVVGVLVARAAAETGVEVCEGPYLEGGQLDQEACLSIDCCMWDATQGKCGSLIGSKTCVVPGKAKPSEAKCDGDDSEISSSVYPCACGMSVCSSGQLCDAKTEKCSLVPYTIGEIVKWTDHDEDVPEGSQGTVKQYRHGLIRAEFNGKVHAFQPTQLLRVKNTCKSDEFASGTRANGESSECQPIRKCSANEFQTKAPTDFSDRECKPLTQCTASEWETDGATETTDRKCAAAPFATGTKVTWADSDNDVPKGTVGTVKEYRNGVVQVEFDGGNTYGFSADSLKAEM